MKVSRLIEGELEFKNGIWYGPKGNYWSNLGKNENSEYMEDLPEIGAYETMLKYFPEHENVIFSLKRAGGIATLDVSEDDIILDAGCMWGALSFPLAQTNAKVVAIDQTEQSLIFLNQRKKEAGLENLELICADLKKVELAEGVFDKVILNGVLEWIPQSSDVEVVSSIGKQGSFLRNLKSLFVKNGSIESPKIQQINFLSKMNEALKDGGVLYLAIENRYDIFYYFGLKEPHSGIRFISIFPRIIGDIISRIFRGEGFLNWTYSKTELREVLKEAGYSKIDIKYGFPGYHHPELVLSEDGFDMYRRCYPWGKKNIFKRLIVATVEEVFFKRLRLNYFSSSFIVHAYK